MRLIGLAAIFTVGLNLALLGRARTELDLGNSAAAAADAAQIQKALHDQWPAAVTASTLTGSTRGVNM